MAGVAVAPAAAAAHTEDDESWLYGDENKEPKDSQKEKNGESDQNNAKSGSELPRKRKKVDGSDKPEDKEEGEMSGEEAKEQDVDSDDDDDDVQVTIGDIKQWTVNEAPRNLFKTGTGYQKPTSGSAVLGKGVLGGRGGLDIEQQGIINGVPTYEFDLDSLAAEDKPWRNPGADITDYFNYGFNEDSWQHYCEKQRRLRLENGVPLLGPKTMMGHIHHSNMGQPITRLGEKDVGQAISSIGTTTTIAGRKAQPPPNRKMGGAIDVIGSTVHDSRRPGGLPAPPGMPITTDFRNFNPSVPPPGMPPIVPDYSMPPPGMPLPPGMPPPVIPPPPGVNIPPVQAFNVPPPGFNFETGNFNAGYGEAHRQNYPGFEERWKYSGERHRDRSPDPGRDSYYRERDRERGDSYRERDRERDRGRESRDRGRESRDHESRDRESRDRVRSRSTERTERDESRHREEKHRARSSRKHIKEEEDDSYRSKHRHSRKRRDKDDEESAGDDGGKD